MRPSGRESIARSRRRLERRASQARFFLAMVPFLEAPSTYAKEKFAEIGAKVRVEDDTTLKLFNLTVSVELSSEQVTDDGLSSALLAFRRAANTLAQVEDHLVFNGRGDAKTEASTKLGKLLPELSATEENVVVSGEKSLSGLVDADTAKQIKASASERAKKKQKPGDHVVTEVANAVVELEKASHPGPFACILGANAFRGRTYASGGAGPPSRQSHAPPERSAFAIWPNGEGTRNRRIARRQPISTSSSRLRPRRSSFRLTSDAKYLFRVYEKFMLRIKDSTAVQGF